MRLTPDARNELLSLLNAPESVAAFVQTVAEHPELARWIGHETDPYDTESSPFRSGLVRWFAELIEERATELSMQNGHNLPLHKWVRPGDFYYFSDAEGLGSRVGRAWLSAAELPLACYRILDTVFEFSVGQQEWTTRPWLGCERGVAGGYDPLLALPYSRKYDWERAEYAIRNERQQWERFARAADLIGVLLGYASKLNISDGDKCWLDQGKVAEALAEDDLAISQCGLMAFGGSLHLDLWELEWAPQKTLAERKQIPGPPAAQATYTGPFTVVEHPSAATRKKLMIDTLELLRERVYELCYHPYYDDEWEERDGALRSARARFGMPDPADAEQGGDDD